jgi:hypothetical protein
MTSLQARVISEASGDARRENYQAPIPRSGTAELHSAPMTFARKSRRRNAGSPY